MGGRFGKYSDYKDSGVEWLGNIPSRWSSSRLKYLCHITTGDKDNVDKTDNGEYPFYVRSKTIERISTFSFDGEAVLTAGDGDIGKIFHYINGKFDFHQRVYKFSSFRAISGRYFHYYISSHLADEVVKLSAKTTVDSLRLPMLQNFMLSIPQKKEQESIVNFLDHETAKIDTLIEKQQKLIELLKEKRQAVISHAVTKGLNPDAPMKDSGVEWLGKVPAHWEVCSLKHKCVDITDGAHISPETENGVHYFVSIVDIKNGIINFSDCLKTSKKSYQYLVNTGCKPNVGDILFSKDGTIGQTAITPKGSDFVVASSLIIIRPNKSLVYPNYMDYLLQSNLVKEQVEGFVKGAALRRLSIQNLLKIFGCFPDLEEQLEVAEYIDEKLQRLQSLQQKAVAAINLMKERRTALISAAVTGKIDVRNWKGNEV